MSSEFATKSKQASQLQRLARILNRCLWQIEFSVCLFVCFADRLTKALTRLHGFAGRFAPLLFACNKNRFLATRAIQRKYATLSATRLSFSFSLSLSLSLSLYRVGIGNTSLL